MEKGGKGFSLPPQPARKSSLKSNPQGLLFCFVGVIFIALYEKKKKNLLVWKCPVSGGLDGQSGSTFYLVKWVCLCPERKKVMVCLRRSCYNPGFFWGVDELYPLVQKSVRRKYRKYYYLKHAMLWSTCFLWILLGVASLKGKDDSSTKSKRGKKVQFNFEG